MKTEAKQGLTAAALLLVVIGVVLWLCVFRGLYAAKQLLAMPLGTDRSIVLASQGEPDEVSTRFRLADYRSYSDETEEAARAGATEFLVWEYLPDLVCCAGFDAMRKLVVRDCGTS